jgi:hypothetical protein
MALLTDGNPNDSEALRVYEAAILDVANVENIDLNVKLGLATEEISEDVLDALLGHTRTLYSLTSPGDEERRRIGVSDVVVSPQMKRWHALHTLAIVYRDAYNNQLNDRYWNKWEEYRELARGAKERTLEFGIGLVAAPVPRAGTPVLAETAGPLAGTIYYAQVSWVSAAGQEGSASCATNFQTTDNSSLTAAVVNAPAIAAGWNVYLGLAISTLTLQNSAPLAIGATFTLPGSGLVNGATGGGHVRDRRPDFEAGITSWRRLRVLRRGKWWRCSPTRLRDWRRWGHRSPRTPGWTCRRFPRRT